MEAGLIVRWCIDIERSSEDCALPMAECGKTFSKGNMGKNFLSGSEVSSTIIVGYNDHRMSGEKPPLKEIPDIVRNPEDGQVYKKGKFLGKGGFARCYELTNVEKQIIYAGKIIPKSLLSKRHQRDKVAQEIRIHRQLNHPNIVRLYGFFEDQDNVYILLELCSRRSLMELHKRRRSVTEPEARYLVKQIVEACAYLHGHRIIHRDLKLGNIFLNDQMQVKIGDFGLATVLDYDGERKRTLCGTPNYIAPEVLDKKGHSYEVDIWAIGCIIYTLLVGKPPFETTSLEKTYSKIQNNDYSIPPFVSDLATKVIRSLLQDDPRRRPTIEQIQKFPFFDGYTPVRLPTSCLVTAPKFSNTEIDVRAGDMENVGQNDENVAIKQNMPLKSKSESHVAKIATTVKQNNNDVEALLPKLLRQINEVLVHGESKLNVIREDLVEDPASTPVYWISKWVDYSDKYGLGYQLCDNSIGVVFNDGSKLVLNANGEQLQFIDRDDGEQFYTRKKFPTALGKKVTLMAYFRNYMSEHLLTTGGDLPVREGDELCRLPVLKTWFRTRTAIVLLLNNGTMQINFFEDHTKIIICPLMGAATYIDNKRDIHVFKLTALITYGCPKDLFFRLKYAKSSVERLMMYIRNPLNVEST